MKPAASQTSSEVSSSFPSFHHWRLCSRVAGIRWKRGFSSHGFTPDSALCCPLPRRISPESQSMSGLCFRNHGRPRIISSFPRSVMKHRRYSVCSPPAAIIWTFATSVIAPARFGVPSIVSTLIGRAIPTQSIPCSATNFRSRKIPSAPESTIAVALRTRPSATRSSTGTRKCPISSLRFIILTEAIPVATGSIFSCFSSKFSGKYEKSRP